MIEKIRKHPKILFVIFSLCCLLFVIEIFIRSFFYLFSNKKKQDVKNFNVVELFDKKLTFNEYRNKADDFYRTTGYYYEKYGISKDSRLYSSYCNNTIINGFINNVVYSKIADNIGIKLTDEDKDEILYGINLDKTIKDSFKDKNGNFDRDKYTEFLQKTVKNPYLAKSWEESKKQIFSNNIIERVENIFKYLTFTNSLELERKWNEKNNEYSIEYLNVKKEVDNNYKPVDIDKIYYYKKHKDEYKTSDSYIIKYFVEDIKLDESSKQKNINNISQLRDKFKECSNPDEFIKINSDIIRDDKYKNFVEYTDDDLPEVLKNNSKNIREGFVVVYIPEKCNDYIRIYKVVKIEKSVNNKKKYHTHILYKKPDINENTKKLIIDKLKKDLSNIKTFDEFKVFANEKGHELRELNLDHDTTSMPLFNKLSEVKKIVFLNCLNNKNLSFVLPTVESEDNIFVGYLFEFKKSGFKDIKDVDTEINDKLISRENKRLTLNKLKRNGTFYSTFNNIKGNKTLIDNGMTFHKEENIKIDSKGNKDIDENLIKSILLLPNKTETSFINNKEYMTKLKIIKFNDKIIDEKSDEFNKFKKDIKEKNFKQDNNIKFFKDFYKIKIYDNAYFLL